MIFSCTLHIMKVSKESVKVYKTLKAKIYKKMTANDSKYYLQYNNTYHHSINKKLFNAN